jgi:hypothetical protein
MSVLGSTVDTVAVQPKEGTCISQQRVMRVRLGKESIAERVDR